MYVEFIHSILNLSPILQPHGVVSVKTRIPCPNWINGRWRIGSSPICPKCHCPPSHNDDNENPFKWEFMLLIEDSQGDTLPVIVADEDAEELLQLSPDKFLPNLKLIDW